MIGGKKITKIVDSKEHYSEVISFTYMVYDLLRNFSESLKETPCNFCGDQGYWKMTVYCHKRVTLFKPKIEISTSCNATFHPKKIVRLETRILHHP